MTITTRMAAFAAGAPAAPEATAALDTLYDALPAPGATDGRAPGGRPASAVVAHWVTAAVLRHSVTAGAGRDRAEQGLAVGLELALRLLRSLDGHVTGGWDPVCAAVVVGAAAGAARVDGLGGEAITRAIGIAATQASGLASVSETPLGTFQNRRAALDGLQAAVLAGSGMTAPATALEGRRGLYGLIAPTAEQAGAVDGLGERWLLADLSHPSGATARDGAHPVADRWPAALAYAKEALS